MAVQITIIGLGQIGASIGLALAEHNELVQRIGHDRELPVAKQAQKRGALDQVKINVPSAVRSADIVLLSLPISEVRAMLELIGPDLKKGAVVMDTTPVKQAVAGWAEELLPEGRFYVGLVPVLNPAYLHRSEVGGEAARADLFHNGLMVISASPATPGEAIRLASDLTRLVGASPLFTDLAEADGLMAATHILPQLGAAALLSTTVDQPGWREGRKLAGRAYAAATAPLVYQDEVGAICDAALLNRQNVVRLLDGMIASLQGLRNSIAEEHLDDLTNRLERARKGRERWWQQRQAADWLTAEEKPPKAPAASEFVQHLVIGVHKRPGRQKDQ
jgi:prephenate dehydrogenase